MTMIDSLYGRCPIASDVFGLNSVSKNRTFSLQKYEGRGRRLSLQLFLGPSNFFQLKKEMDSILETFGLLHLPNTIDHGQCDICKPHFVQVEILFESSERLAASVV
jgi:hypothetical protein